MAKQKRFYLKWGRGALEAYFSMNLIEVRASNAMLVFEPRSIVVEASYADTRIVDSNRHRNVYIDFSEVIKPIEKPPRIDVIGRQLIGLIDVRVTDLEFAKYLTIITPGGFLYDYLVLSEEKLYLHALSKRKVFFEKIGPRRLVIYMV